MSAGVVVARTRTLWRSSGGKSGRAAAAGLVGEAGEAVALEAAAPLGDGAGVAAKFVGDVVIAWDASAGGAAEDDTGAEGEALGGGGGVGQALEAEGCVGGEEDAGCFAGHGARSLCMGTRVGTEALEGRADADGVQARKCTRMFTLTAPSCQSQA